MTRCCPASGFPRPCPASRGADGKITVSGDERGQALLASIEAPWRAALQEGWVAFGAGNPPVGAVITGPDGAVVATGRNRRHDRDGPASVTRDTWSGQKGSQSLVRLPAARCTAGSVVHRRNGAEPGVKPAPL
jgi:hypothetical protein